MPAFNSRIQKALTDRLQQGLNRQLNVLNPVSRSEVELDSKVYSNFSSNDYLGLANDPELVSAWQDGLSQYGAGSGASPLVTGFSAAHQNLESQLCEWLGYERAILFSSGFSANQALLFSLLDKNDTLIQDRLNHASLMEAGALSPAKMKRFKHNDVAHLASQLAVSENALVVTEGVFSMDGDQAPLNEVARVTEQSDAWLAVDDAHGIGILGEYGAGSCAAAGVKPELLVVTFGKAFGLSGAAILCSKEVGDYLTQFARHHVYSTAIPPAQAFALSTACRMIQTQQWRRDKLNELQAIYHEGTKGLKGHIETNTPIKPFMVGQSEHAISIANRMKESGIWMTAIRPPTVPVGTARLRITLTANHSPEQVSQLTHSLKSALETQREVE
ncbi:8-amino-7-oxononanoate synthase [Vibrio sp. THAF190c]|uniref:8-amino-7-oxononanoate synthase n=1 Tax=Vibrio sp. THAF190c TaxID=2587865 RepID=UPI001268057B|nr:8-amino-7-oxononanoate synthase [Vibrio sp. THAF190c]QFT10235.1 8-amino-7-oxononanoate synthase [Vibrio sp. THAF190c]